MAVQTTPGAELVLDVRCYDVLSGRPYAGAATIYAALKDTTAGLWWDANTATWGAEPALADHLPTAEATAGDRTVTIPAGATLGLTGHNLRLWCVTTLDETAEVIISEVRSIQITTPAGTIIVNPQDVTPGQMIARQNLVQSITRGDTPTIAYTLGFDCTGFTGYFGAKRRLQDAALAISEREIVWSDQAQGAFEITLTREETLALKQGEYVGTVQLRDGVSVFSVVLLTLFVEGNVL